MAGKNGIPANNTVTRVEPLLSVKMLKERYLFGVTPIVDDQGNELPTSVYQAYIGNAVSMLEHFLDIRIAPTTVVENKDYRSNDYWEWGYMMLENIPIIKIEKFEAVYLQDEDVNGNLVDNVVLSIPKTWWRFDQHNGLIRLLPNNVFPAPLQIGSDGHFFPELFRRYGTVPHLWRITYQHGFEDGKVPMAINQAIGYLAAIQALNIAGDLIIGAGIAGESLSLDGLSQSIQTTSSAENHGYSAKVKEYQKILFGTSKDDPAALLRMLKAYYQGTGLNII